MTLEYTTPHTPQPNGVIERRFDVIKEGALVMLINAKQNGKAQKILWSEAVSTCEHVRNSMGTMGSTTSPFGNVYGEKPISLVRSWCLDVLDTSPNRTSSRSELQTKHLRRSWWDTPKIIRGIRTSFTIHKPRESL